MSILPLKLLCYRAFLKCLWHVDKHGVLCLAKFFVKHDHSMVLNEYAVIGYLLLAIECWLYAEFFYEWLEFCAEVLPLINPFHKKPRPPNH